MFRTPASMAVANGMVSNPIGLADSSVSILAAVGASMMTTVRVNAK